VAWAKKIIQLSVCPINGMLVTITHNAGALAAVARNRQHLNKASSHSANAWLYVAAVKLINF